jgi:beta-mannosidase
MNRNRALCVLLLLGAPPPAFPRNAIPLDGPGWKLAGALLGKGEEQGFHARMPGSVRLFDVSVPNNVQLSIGIKDPYGQSPELADVNRKEWWYYRRFRAPATGAGQRARLLFEGADYFAAVWLNGSRLGEHEGAYTQFFFDVTSLLKQDRDNLLAVRVSSPLVVPGRTRSEFMKGEFAEEWDALPGPGQYVNPLGLHRSVRLEITGASRIEHVAAGTVRLQENRAAISVRASVSSSRPAPAKLSFVVRPENSAGPAIQPPPVEVQLPARPGEEKQVAIEVEVENPRLWWTWDLGPQNLYTVTATLQDANGSTLDQTGATFGIRTIERDSNLLYRINGRTILLRGAWLSLSRLYPASTDRWTYEKDLRLARNANINHLINFTVVEKDDFYELADRLGILIFVELPFRQLGPLDTLDQRHPRRKEYLQWASGEAGRIARALSNHPSVAVWSAIAETAASEADFKLAEDGRLRAAADGYRQFVRMVETAIRENDPDALYHDSYCDFGERHFWFGGHFRDTVFSQHFDAGANFVSEYGAMAFVAPESLRRIVDPSLIWGNARAGWSPLKLPIDLTRMSELHGWQYSGLELVAKRVWDHVDRKPPSLRDYAADTQVYQALLYEYAAEAYRRKLFAPVNGIRSWHFKDFGDSTISGYGVIDAFHVPKPAYYAMKRAYAPISLSLAIREPLDSSAAGARWQAPLWISNAGREKLDLAVETALWSLTGKRIRESVRKVAVEAHRAAIVDRLDWTLPEEAGVYLVRSRALAGRTAVASAETYLKVAPRVLDPAPRVLVVGTTNWTAPVACHLEQLGARVTVAARAPNLTSFQPADRFPGNAAELQRDFDLIWLAGFNAYWREAPEAWTATIVSAVEAGVPMVHTGSWGSCHGGNYQTAALDLTPLARLLPVELKHENDVWTDSLTPAGAGRTERVQTLAASPDWLRRLDFSGFHVGSYHQLQPNDSAAVLMRVDGQPLLVKGRHGKGTVMAWLAFSPAVSPKGEFDAALRSSGEHRSFFLASALLLALASGRATSIDLPGLLEARTTPLFEMLRKLPPGPLPKASLRWESATRAHVVIRNGRTYCRGLRVTLEGPDVHGGDALQVWDRQFFDLLPSEQKEAQVEIVMKGGGKPQSLSLRMESMYGSSAERQDVSQPRQ